MKLLHEIKFGQTVYNLLTVNAATTYDQISKSTGLAPKQLQKALTDLCKAGYVMKTDRRLQAYRHGFAAFIFKDSRWVGNNYLTQMAPPPAIRGIVQRLMGMKASQLAFLIKKTGVRIVGLKDNSEAHAKGTSAQNAVRL